MPLGILAQATQVVRRPPMPKMSHYIRFDINANDNTETARYEKAGSGKASRGCPIRK